MTEALDLGWARLKNGALLKAAESAEFEVMVNADRNLKYLQNLAERKIALVILPSGRCPLIKQQLAEVVKAVDHAAEGSYQEIPLRFARVTPPPRRSGREP